MTSEAEIATWNHRIARGDLVLIDSLTEVAIVNGWAQLAQGAAVVELCSLGRWPLADLLPLRGRDLRYLQTFVRCDHCGAAPRQRCTGYGSHGGRQAHMQRLSALAGLIDRRMSALLDRRAAVGPG